MGPLDHVTGPLDHVTGPLDHVTGPLDRSFRAPLSRQREGLETAQLLDPGSRSPPPSHDQPQPS